MRHSGPKRGLNLDERWYNRSGSTKGVTRVDEVRGGGITVLPTC